MTEPNSHAGPATTIQTNRGSRTTVLSTRRPTPAPREGGLLRVPQSDSPEPPIALLELGHRDAELARAEVRPQDRRHPQLGVGDLPQQEVGEALLATGTDQQVGIGHAVGVERAR